MRSAGIRVVVGIVRRRFRTLSTPASFQLTSCLPENRTPAIAGANDKWKTASLSPAAPIALYGPPFLDGSLTTEEIAKGLVQQTLAYRHSEARSWGPERLQIL
jgi:hypothetical protein